MNRPATEGFQKPLRGGERKKVGLAVIRYVSANAAVCSCGAPFAHRRAKVVENKIDRHILKKHAGRGVRL